MIKAVVFDFDGVLANSEPLHFRAYRDVLASGGFTLTEAVYYAKYLGYDDVGAFRAMAADAGVTLCDAAIEELVARKAVRLEELEGTSSVLFPGAREAIVRLAAGGPVAIASGALKAEIARILDREGLRSYFPVLVSAGDTPASKPDPAPYALAVKLLSAATTGGLRPDECVAIEDSMWGLQSARAAGLRTVAITNTYSRETLGQDQSDAVVDHLDELTSGLFAAITR